jgi:hypothetical protein
MDIESEDSNSIDSEFEISSRKSCKISYFNNLCQD